MLGRKKAGIRMPWAFEPKQAAFIISMHDFKKEEYSKNIGP